MRPISLIVGGWTLIRMSASSRTSCSTCAPFTSYSTSRKPADWPAPGWTTTFKLAFVSMGTSSGTSATRCSPGVVSFGTLRIIYIGAYLRMLLARYFIPVSGRLTAISPSTLVRTIPSTPKPTSFSSAQPSLVVQLWNHIKPFRFRATAPATSSTERPRCCCCLQTCAPGGVRVQLEG